MATFTWDHIKYKCQSCHKFLWQIIKRRSRSSWNEYKNKNAIEKAVGLSATVMCSENATFHNALFVVVVAAAHMKVVATYGWHHK